MARFFCPLPLHTGDAVSLPPSAARHVQVLRLQPGDGITLFNGEGGEYAATVTRMGRSDVDVSIGAHTPLEREAPCAVHVLAGITANERMDWLVEKATELGAASLTPITAERSVLKLKGERADKKGAHWQAVAVAASEQCGRNRVTRIDPACSLADWLARHPATVQTGLRLVLSLSVGSQALKTAVQAHTHITLLSGPEGGLTPAEEAQALAAGFLPVSLGPRVLRAETAPLAVLAALTL
ncbi:16S rRNA (uracil(1498)-N(3))-methyltransferase [Limnohabitans sp. Rim8]|uniref:16S rRNA (uracil(1498)-N(3))-methyltransferase n=1 Tax=Limnohabitans sp. Rim8 TaxID=1100718 RepID=UPI0026321D97|nr:16S rRNA (uracil(1498)-N(3))-methyltransferase [Limnohabitans sp. Rim8]